MRASLIIPDKLVKACERMGSNPKSVAQVILNQAVEKRAQEAEAPATPSNVIPFPRYQNRGEAA